MKKPKFIKRRPIMDYNQMIDYIEQKYKIHTRDFAKKFVKGGNIESEYLDYWHWLLDNCFSDIHNGSSAYWNVKEIIDSEETPLWVKSITEKVYKEFHEVLDNKGGLEVLIQW